MQREPQPGSFGEKLRASRRRAGLTQQQLGRQAGVSVRSVRNIEAGRVRRPRPESVRRLAVTLGLDPTEATTATASDGAHLDPGTRRPDNSPTGAQRLSIGVLGLLTIRQGPRLVVGPPMQRSLLGLLAAQPNQMVGYEEIVDALWDGDPPPSCRSMVRAYITRLRKLLEPPKARGKPGQVLVSAGGGCALEVGEDELDLLRFDGLAAAARKAQVDDPELALELLGRALSCWRGPVLADLPARVRQHPAAVAVTQRRLVTTLTFADVAIPLGEHQQAAERLRPLAPEEPLHEGLHARLMLALAGDGQQAAALELFTRLRGRLIEELGVEPGAELQDAQARVLQGDLPGIRPPDRAATSGVARPPRPAQLPADVAGFTGRTSHLDQLDTLLQTREDGGDGQSTAVVLTAVAGAAGVGKTALAVHWAHRVAERFGDGQLYVNLQGYAQTSPLEPLQALAGLLRALGVAPEQVPTDVDQAAGLYRSLLAGKRVLVVLDNAHDAEQVRPLLPGSPTCVVLITSRDRLTGLVATHAAHRLTLDVLDPDEAVMLLGHVLGVERVAAEPEAARELAHTCGLLPLALRIAAANLTGRPEQSIAGYLAELHGGDRLAGLAVAGDAQAAVRVAFDHSYDRLGADGRRLFRLLGLVPGPQVSVPGAAALAGVAADTAGRLLNELADAHLVEPHGRDRYGLHDLLGLYARQCAQREDGQKACEAALGRLLEWYLHAADAAARLLYPEALRLPFPVATAPVGFAAAADAAAWLDTEQASLIATVAHTAEHGPYPAAWRLADALRAHLALRRSTAEWLGVARAGLAAAITTADLRAQAACQLSLGQAQLVVGHSAQAIQSYAQAHARAGQAGWTDAQAAALTDLGMALWWSGRLAEAADHTTRALTLARQTGWAGGQATAYLYLGLIKRDMGHLQQAADHHTQALTLYHRLGSRRGQVYALDGLGIVEHELGRLDHAQRHLTRALSLPWGVDDRDGHANGLCALAEVHRDAGRLPQALQAAQTALILLAGEAGFRYTEAAARIALAIAQLHAGHAQETTDQAHKALDLARASGLRRLEVDALLALANACQHTGQPTQAVSHARQALDIASQAGFRVLEGQAHTALALAWLRLGSPHDALSHTKQALDLHRQTGYRLGLARTQHVLGSTLHATGDLAAAVRCWREALELFTDIGSPEADEIRKLLDLDT